jgi:uncharacterized protein (TIGR00369 family)
VSAAPEARRAADSRITVTRLMTSVDANLHGNVHGGVIMKLVDDAGGIVAARHSGGRAVTVAMDEMVFLVPVHVGDLVFAHAQVNWAGRTSMEIGVRVEAEPWDSLGERRHTSTAYLAYVGIDEEGRPRAIPPVEVEGEVEQRRYREAEIRRAARLERREAIRRSRS